MINAFKEIRLTNANVKVSGADSRLYVGANTTVFQSETGVFLTSGQTGNFVTMSQTGQFYAASNPSNYTTIAAVDASYYLRSNPSGYIGSAQTGAFATSANLISTGSNLQEQISTTNTNVTTTQTNLASTGSNLQGQVNTLTTNLASSGNTFALWTGKFQSFITAISPGLDIYPISFPIVFSSIPKVVSSLEITGEILYNIAVQTRSTTGYFCLFSDIVTENVSINTIATLN